jgi:hypothetical protein
MEAGLIDIGKALAKQLPPLSAHEAAVEADRCLYCYDAPCTHACPTHIAIPRLIKKIATGNLHGSAKTIFDSNLRGAARRSVVVQFEFPRSGGDPPSGVDFGHGKRTLTRIQSLESRQFPVLPL